MRKGAKLISICLGLVFFLLFAINDIYPNACSVSGLADFCGDAGGNTVGGNYVITLKKIEISQDGTNFVTVGESSGTTVDIGGMNVGTSLQSFATNVSIPAGVYHYLRVTISRTIAFKGMGLDSGTYYYTSSATGTAGSPPFPIAAQATSWGAGDTPLCGGVACATPYTQVSVTIPSDAPSHMPAGQTAEFVNGGADFRITIQLDTPFTVKASVPPQMKLMFYTQGMIGLDCGGGGCVMFPLPPREDVNF